LEKTCWLSPEKQKSSREIETMMAEAVRAGAASVDGISVRLLSVDKAESSDVLAAELKYIISRSAKVTM
jgi:hypothetical protein